MNTSECHHLRRDWLHSRNASLRSSRYTGWLVPTAILMFLPKCPACLAIFLAIATGIGVSVPSAARLRIAIMFLCALWLLYAAHLLVSRLMLGKPAQEENSNG